MKRIRRIRSNYDIKRLEREINRDIVKNVERALNGQKPIKYDYQIKIGK